jgi:hypothetical protein
LTPPCCIVEGCTARIVAEVHTDSYADALALFRGVHRQKVRIRRLGDERFFVCQHHLECDERMRTLDWQFMFRGEDHDGY